jgi:tRNA uridine 5-carboxymethylaminomethyl modification enzyme
VPQKELEAFAGLSERTQKLATHLEKTRIPVAALGAAGARFRKNGQTSLANLLRQPNLTVDEALAWAAKFDGEFETDQEAWQRAAILIRYRGYLDKQQREIDKFRRMEALAIPEGFEYDGIAGLKKEAAEKLSRFRPRSLGQAGRLEGVSPGDLAILSVHLKRQGAQAL